MYMRIKDAKAESFKLSDIQILSIVVEYWESDNLIVAPKMTVAINDSRDVPADGDSTVSRLLQLPGYTDTEEFKKNIIKTALQAANTLPDYKDGFWSFLPFEL